MRLGSPRSRFSVWGEPASWFMSAQGRRCKGTPFHSCRTYPLDPVTSQRFQLLMPVISGIRLQRVNLGGGGHEHLVNSTAQQIITNLLIINLKTTQMINLYFQRSEVYSGWSGAWFLLEGLLESISLSFPASRSRSHSLASGPFSHLQSQLCSKWFLLPPLLP